MTKKERALRLEIEEHARRLHYAVGEYASFAGVRLNAARDAVLRAADGVGKDGLNLTTDEALFRASKRLVRARRRFDTMGDTVPSPMYRNGRGYVP